MALNSSGKISLGGSTVGESINLQIGSAATAQVSFNDTAVRSLSQVTTTNAQEVMPTDFYGKGATVSYVTTSVQLSTTASSYTFSGISIGAADTNRWVILAIGGGSGTSATVTNVTVNGNAATQLSPSSGIALWGIKLTTGTTANVVITFSVALVSGFGIMCGVYRALNVTTLAANASVLWTTSKTATLNVTGSAAGFVIGVAYDDNSTGITWTGLTSNYSANPGGTGTWASSASSNFATGGAKSISSTFTGGGGTLATFLSVYVV